MTEREERLRLRKEKRSAEFFSGHIYIYWWYNYWCWSFKKCEKYCLSGLVVLRISQEVNNQFNLRVFSVTYLVDFLCMSYIFASSSLQWILDKQDLLKERQKDLKFLSEEEYWKLQIFFTNGKKLFNWFKWYSWLPLN